MPKVVDADQNRRLIAEAACRAIAEKGIARATMKDIAAAAGASTGMIVNYFPNKEAIIAAALRLPFERIEERIAKRLASGATDLAEMLEPAIPAGEGGRTDVAVWVAFWGLIATDEKFRQLNAELHQEGLGLFARALRAGWPESADWPRPVFDDALRAVLTCLFGLSAGGATNPGTWSAAVQRRQLRLHLDVMRDWANARSAEVRLGARKASA